MTTWLYYAPANAQTPAPPGYVRLEGAETLGRTQAGVMLRARKSVSGMVIPNGDRERLALRRLQARGLVTVRRLYGGLRVGQLTRRGRTAWLRVKEER